MLTANDLPRGLFEDAYGPLPARYLGIVAPGRTELAGNHTDHEGGHVIAAAVDRAVHAVAAPTGGGLIRLSSEGYDPVEIDLADLSARPEEREMTAALVRGVAAQVAAAGHAPSGADIAIASSVAAGSGLSSSAAFELAVAQALNALWADGALAPVELAVMAQRAENDWFGKPCGLMDQAAVALGGIQHMSFAHQGTVEAEPIAFDFDAAGYALCLVDVGSDHAANTADYAAVPAEMQAVARELGATRLGEIDESEVLAASSRIRCALGDRALLRAVHYFREERLVAARADALRANNVIEFIDLMRLSGASSAMYLQNVSIGGANVQPAMVALSLGEELLGRSGACRIHGGGFGGTVQALVPYERLDHFTAGMEAVFGQGSCGVCAIDHEGARFSWL